MLPFFVLAALVVFPGRGAWSARPPPSARRRSCSRPCRRCWRTPASPPPTWRPPATRPRALCGRTLAGAAHRPARPRRSGVTVGARRALEALRAALPARRRLVAVALLRRGRAMGPPAGPWPRLGRSVCLRPIFAVWAGYRFSIGPLVTAGRHSARSRPDAQGDFGGLYRAAYTLARAPVFPAPALFEGLGQLAAKNRAGHKSYLLGRGAAARLVVLLPRGARGEDAARRSCCSSPSASPPRCGCPGRRAGVRWLEPAAIAVAILLVCLPSRINIGLRHVLPMYPFLAVMAGAGAVALWRSRRTASSVPAAVALLVGWQVVARLRVAPGLPRLLQRAGRQPPRADPRGQRSGRRPGPQAPGRHPARAPRPGSRRSRTRAPPRWRSTACRRFAGWSPTGPSPAGWPRASSRSSWARSTGPGTTTSPGSSATARWPGWDDPSASTTSRRPARTRCAECASRAEGR